MALVLDTPNTVNNVIIKEETETITFDSIKIHTWYVTNSDLTIIYERLLNGVVLNERLAGNKIVISGNEFLSLISPFYVDIKAALYSKVIEKTSLSGNVV